MVDRVQVTICLFFGFILSQHLSFCQGASGVWADVRPAVVGPRSRFQRFGRRQGSFFFMFVCFLIASKGAWTYRDNSNRGCSYHFSFRAVLEFLHANDLFSVIRGHEVMYPGFQMYKVGKRKTTAKQLFIPL
jgi:hypothetical protein